MSFPSYYKRTQILEIVNRSTFHSLEGPRVLYSYATHDDDDDNNDGDATSVTYGLRHGYRYFLLLFVSLPYYIYQEGGGGDFL